MSPVPRATKSGVMHRKKCRHPKTPADLMRRYCLVCGCKAENYNFGVVSCESCKAFFRRNAHKQILGEAGVACVYQHGLCDVTMATRKKCPGCRLAKCFRVGMQADLIQKVDFSQHPQQHQQPQHEHHLARLWQCLQPAAAAAAAASASKDLPQLQSDLTEPGMWPGAPDRRCANILLIDFFEELRALVKDTILGEVVPPELASAPAPDDRVTVLEGFVHQAGRFISGLRQIDRLERGHFVALLRSRLHSVLLPLSCAGFCRLDGRFYFTIGGSRIACHPIELFCDLVRQSSSRLVDYTALADYRTYAGLLGELTEMRPELLALFCAVKLFCLPTPAAAASASAESDCRCRLDDPDGRLRGACDRLGARYHQHLLDAIYYHYPFDFDSRLRLCCRLFAWSAEFDRTLANLIENCPLG